MAIKPPPQPKDEAVEFKSRYKRPCLATSTTGKSGVIILKSGISTAEFQSIQKGKEILKELVAGKLVSFHDEERIEDHLNASDLPATEKRSDPCPTSSLLLFAALGALLDLRSSAPDPHKHQCSNCSTVWEHDSSELVDAGTAHRCPKCGKEQWHRV